MLTRKLILLLVTLSACAEGAGELAPYACRAQIERWPQHDLPIEVFYSGMHESKEDAKDVFGTIIHQRGLAIYYPELYNTLSWDCEKIPFCSELGCGPEDYSLKCAHTGDCQCDPDARGPEPTQQCYPDATVRG